MFNLTSNNSATPTNSNINIQQQHYQQQQQPQTNQQLHQNTNLNSNSNNNNIQHSNNSNNGVSNNGKQLESNLTGSATKERKRKRKIDTNSNNSLGNTINANNSSPVPSATHFQTINSGNNMNGDVVSSKNFKWDYPPTNLNNQQPQQVSSSSSVKKVSGKDSFISSNLLKALRDQVIAQIESNFFFPEIATNK